MFLKKLHFSCLYAKFYSEVTKFDNLMQIVVSQLETLKIFEITQKPVFKITDLRQILLLKNTLIIIKGQPTKYRRHKILMKKAATIMFLSFSLMASTAFSATGQSNTSSGNNLQPSPPPLPKQQATTQVSSYNGALNGNDNLNVDRNGSVLIGDQKVSVQLDIQQNKPIVGNSTNGNQNSDGNRGNNNGNVIINGNAPTSNGSGADQFFANAKGDAYGNGQTKITLHANQDQNGDGKKGDQIFTIDATGTGQSGGNVQTQGEGDFGMGNLNGNGNGNTLLNIDFYDYEGDDQNPQTQAHVSSASPIIDTIQRYAGSAMNFISSLFGKK